MAVTVDVESPLHRAFGVVPSDSVAPGGGPVSHLPRGTGLWAEAVDLGARGGAAAARRRLAAVIADPSGDRRIAALACSTWSSLTRQAGGHRDARAGDAAACALVATADRVHDRWARAAWVDALVGLAADDLGIAAYSAAAALLDRARSALAAQPAPAGPAAGEDGGSGTIVDWVLGARLRLRVGWVSAELALYRGDVDGAVAAVTEVRELGASAPAARYRVKTALIVAAADAAAGKSADAVAGAQSAHDLAATHGLVPLQWAAASMLAGIIGDSSEYAASSDVLRGRMVAEGMSFVGCTRRVGAPR